MAATIILIGSMFGMMGILFRKIPVLVTLPEKSRKRNLFSKFKKNVKKSNLFRNFSYEIFLQKLLSKIRILTLKTDSKTSNWLQKLRALQREKLENDNYWQNLKKIKKRKRT